ncbi:MAG: SUMF1/EgtB/PvdO family nonheme iron enzyme [Kiritimatiellae bacterium]|nr:SUMF1/EgtB/PvdO family nonheme iron enzyme [Kiritimatiellia bacterium]
MRMAKSVLGYTLAGLLAMMAGLTVLAAPQVKDVRMVQRKDSYTVDIYYKLTGGSAYITLAIETNAATAPTWAGVKIPDRHVSCLTGDVSRLIAPDEVNEKHIVWNAGENWPGQSVVAARPKISAWAPENPPLYAVLDLGGAFWTNKLELLAYTSAEALPHGGLSNDVYRANLLVMRRIPAGTFWMGSHTGVDAWAQPNENWHEVTLTNDFYIGVFEVTQAQWHRVMNSYPSGNANSSGTYDQLLRPVENVTYGQIRGGDWPSSETASADSFIGALRRKTGIRFDLPTEAQWEYACRAGTQTALYNGLPLTTTSALCPNRDPLAWDNFNSGTAPGVNRRHHRVGEKQPNAWGLYDMLGNVNEMVRDWYTANLGTAAVVEPAGPATGNARVRKSGAYDGMRDPRAAYRTEAPQLPSVGFRLAVAAPFRDVPNTLSASDFSFDGPLGSRGATVEKLGHDHFRVNLTTAPGSSDWSNMCQFMITNNAVGAAPMVEFADYTVWATSGGNEKSGMRRFGSWSYDMQEWHPLLPVNVNNKATLVFPAFTQNTVYFGGEVPMAYETMLELIDGWQAHPDVTVTNIGTSVEGRAIYRVTVTAAESPYTLAQRWGHHFVNQHCYEYNAQWRIASMLDWFLSEAAASYRQKHVGHFVLQMNVDGAHNGFGRVNCEGIDMNRSYSTNGWADNLTTESRAVQKDLEQLAASATGIVTTWSMHTWEGRQTESMVRPGPEMGTTQGPWTEFRDILQGNDPNNLFKVLYNVTSPLTPATWTSGTHGQFGNTAFCIEGAGNLYSHAEVLETGRVLMQSLMEYYKGVKP